MGTGLSLSSGELGVNLRGQNGICASNLTETKCRREVARPIPFPDLQEQKVCGRTLVPDALQSTADGLRLRNHDSRVDHRHQQYLHRINAVALLLSTTVSTSNLTAPYEISLT